MLTSPSQKIRVVSISAFVFLCIVLTPNFANSQNTSPSSNTAELESLNSDNTTASNTINRDGLQIFLRNDTTGISEGDERTYNLIVPVITAVGAIGGAVAGTYFTSRGSMNLEKKKIDEQKRKEEEISRRVHRMVFIDLAYIQVTVEEFLKNDELNEDDRIEFKTMMTAERQYPKMPIEMKVSSFNPETLMEVEGAYAFIRLTDEIFKVTWPKYESGEMNFKQLKQMLSLVMIKETCQKAIDKLSK